MFGDPVSPCSSWNIVRSGSDLFFMFIENKFNLSKIVYIMI